MGDHKRTRTMTMSWDGLALDDDDDDDFYDSNNRISAVVPFDSHSPEDSSDEDTFEEPRLSFASAVSSSSSSSATSDFGGVSTAPPPQPATTTTTSEDFEMWLVAPASISERRRRLLKGMGLNSSKELLRLSTSIAMSKKFVDPSPEKLADDRKISKEEEKEKTSCNGDEVEHHHTPPQSHSPLLIRSRSDSDIDPFSAETKRRKEQIMGSNVSKQKLTRTSSNFAPFTSRISVFNPDSNTTPKNDDHNTNVDQISSPNVDRNAATSTKRNTRAHQQSSDQQLGAFFLIKNLDTGKEFVVKEFANDGMWNRLSDLQTGRQLTMEEFEKSVGYSPVVKELMRRQNVGLTVDQGGSGAHLERKTSLVNALKKFGFSKRRRNSLLKSINKSISEKGRDKDHKDSIAKKNGESSSNSNEGSKEWVKVRTQGKIFKELTALRLCQEIRAHQGSIWAMKFNADGRYLASAGEDMVIHVWEVNQCEIASSSSHDDEDNSTVTTMTCPSPDIGIVGSPMVEKKNMPDYVRLPETIFALSNEPVFSFHGHLDAVLDLSWSTSQLRLLSSSMDKTVRLWDLEKKACLRLFEHNDYVTCIQFNPVDDDYFISGALDAKVRIWNVPKRQIVDWTDLNEMVTAASYTPDGQGAVVGSHKGNIRTYSITDGKLDQTNQFVIQTKKKSGPKKVTGFQFPADDPSKVLVSSADSRIRIYDGLDLTQKFKGLRNTSSQIAASFSPDGKYVISASEDSSVYIWRREQQTGKSKSIIRTKTYEYFPCKDVSVAIPWPGSAKFEPPTVQLHSKRHSRRYIASLVSSAVGSPKRDGAEKNTKRPNLPPLPNKKESNATENKSNNNNKPQNSPTNAESEGNNIVEADQKVTSSPESESSRITRSESGFSDSFNSSTIGGSRSLRHGESPSITSSTYGSSSSFSWGHGWSWFDGSGSHGSGDIVQARAWGLVVVTAGLGGEIRAYQNIGIPVKVGRQGSILR